jgi:hypothetical protein
MRKYLPPIPEGWELVGKGNYGKRIIRCKKLDSHGNQCIREIRFSTTPQLHSCKFRPNPEPDLIQTPIERWASLSLDQRLQTEVASLVAITDAPLEIVENETFIKLLNSFVELGRSDPQIHIGSERFKLTRSRTRSVLIESSHKIHQDMIRRFAIFPCVSLAIDAGTIEGRHFLDIMILAPYTKIQPFLYATIEKSSLNAEDYGNIVVTAIKELKQKGVKIRSIVGDNLPAQITALAHWSSRSILKRDEEAYLHGIKYLPCMCHFIQLVVGDLITENIFRNFEQILQEMIKVANFSEIHQIIKSHCPQSVKTRWLSRSEGLNWLLTRKSKLLNIDSNVVPKVRRTQFQAAMTGSNFSAIEIYHRIIYPLSRAVQFFEKDSITLCHVYPVLKTLKKHFREEEHFKFETDPEYAACCSTAVTIIKHRCRKLLDMDLVKAAYWLTSFGCQSLSDNVPFIPSPYILNLEYNPAWSQLPTFGPLYRRLNIISGTQDLEEQEQDEVDYSYSGDVIMVDELEEVPKIGNCNHQVLRFLQELLTAFILEDGDPEIVENDFADVNKQVEETLQFFFCNPETIAKCQD